MTTDNQNLIQDFIKTFLSVAIKTSLYSPEHAKVREAIAETYEKLCVIFESTDQLTVGIAEEKLLVEGEEPELPEMVYHKFVSLLERLHIESIVFNKGITSEEWIAFSQIIVPNPEKIREAGGVTKFLNNMNLKNISINEVSYMKVPKGTDPNAVMSKKLKGQKELLEDAIIMNYLINKIDSISSDNLAQEAEFNPARLSGLINKLVKDSGFVSEDDQGESKGVASSSIEKIGGDIAKAGVTNWDKFRDHLVNIIIALDPDIRNAIAKEDYSIDKISENEDVVATLAEKISEKVKTNIAFERYKNDKNIESLEEFISQIAETDQEKKNISKSIKDEIQKENISQLKATRGKKLEDGTSEETEEKGKKQAEIKPEPKPEPKKKVQLLRKKILVVDEDEETRAKYCTLLEEHNLETHEAADGLTIVKKIENNEEIDLVIMELKLPEMHGFEVLEHLRMIGKHIPIIVCTAYKELKDDISIISYPKIVALDKPVSDEKLIVNVQLILGLEVDRTKQDKEKGKPGGKTW